MLQNIFMSKRVKFFELPQYLDVLLILNDKNTRSKIYKILPRSKDYITSALRYLLYKELINISEYQKDERTVTITLTPKGVDAQKMILQLYNLLGLKIMER